jgi:hypothetical protein
MFEYDSTQTFTSTGATAWQDAYHAVNHTFVFETAAGSTCTLRPETRLKGGDVGILLSTAVVNMGASSAVAVSIVGALYQTRIRVTDITSTGTVKVHLFGNS